MTAENDACWNEECSLPSGHDGLHRPYMAPTAENDAAEAVCPRYKGVRPGPCVFCGHSHAAHAEKDAPVVRCADCGKPSTTGLYVCTDCLHPRPIPPAADQGGTDA